MAFSLRLPPELEADLKQLAVAHSRSMHGEMLHALKTYTQQEKGKSFIVNEKLVKAIQDEIVQAREEGMEGDDLKWMATGAGIRFGRESGVIGQDEVSPEMAGAIKAVVEQELKK